MHYHYFIVNISPEQVSAVEEKIVENAGVTIEHVFPMIRGRLNLLNSNEILSVLSSDKKGDEIFQERPTNKAFLIKRNVDHHC